MAGRRLEHISKQVTSWVWDRSDGAKLGKVRLVSASLLAIAFAIVFAIPAQTQDDPLAAFHRALRRSGERRARVVVHGASHTAGDEYTSELRRRLQARYGDAGPGWVLPASPFPYYHHARVEIAAHGWRGLKVRGRDRVRTEYGYAGFAVEGVTATSRLVSEVPVDHIEVHYLGRGGGGTIHLDTEHGELGSIDTSQTRGPQRRVFELDAPARELSTRLEGGLVRIFGIVLEKSEHGVTVDAFGVPGARVWDQVPWRARSIRTQIQTRPPDLWALAYGTNESAMNRVSIREYRRRLDVAVRRWKGWAPRASCMLIGPGEWPKRTRRGWVARPRTREIIAAQREVATAHGCAFFDTFAMMGGEGSMHRWVAEGLAIGDHVHFTEEGYRRMGAALHRALMQR